MNKYTVNITDEAVADMEALYDYIANVKRAPENAMGQYNRIAAAILTLDEFPDRFGVFDPGIVTVTDVLYGASDVHNRLQVRR